MIICFTVYLHYGALYAFTRQNIFYILERQTRLCIHCTLWRSECFVCVYHNTSFFYISERYEMYKMPSDIGTIPCLIPNPREMEYTSTVRQSLENWVVVESTDFTDEVQYLASKYFYNCGLLFVTVLSNSNQLKYKNVFL